MDSNRAYGIPNRRDYQNPVWHCGESNAMAEPEEEHTYEEVAWYICWPKWETNMCQM